jgi:hypothetical protein
MTVGFRDAGSDECNDQSSEKLPANVRQKRGKINQEPSAAQGRSCSAGAFVVMGFFIIFNSNWGKDEPQILHYAIMINCPMGADVRQSWGLMRLGIGSSRANDSAARACTEK